MKQFLTALVVFFAALPAMAAEINVYSARHYDTDKAIFDVFTKNTGIKVNLLQSSGAQLLARLEAESDKSTTDILITTSAAHVFRASDKKIFAPITTQASLDRVPLTLKADDASWVAFALRARIIFANPDLVDISALKTYADLADPKYKGKLCMRSGGNEYNIALLSSLVTHMEADKAEAWARGVVANFARAPQGNDRDNIMAVANGICGITVANTYYYGILMDTASADDKKSLEKVTKIFPNQDSTGAHINISAVSILKSAPHKREAEQFVSFLLSNDTQKALVAASHEYPAVSDPALSNDKPAFKMDAVSPTIFGKNTSAAQSIVDKVGWQ